MLHPRFRPPALSLKLAFAVALAVSCCGTSPSAAHASARPSPRTSSRYSPALAPHRACRPRRPRGSGPASGSSLRPAAPPRRSLLGGVEAWSRLPEGSSGRPPCRRGEGR
ncbi:hypothetical protein C2845_PM04G33570 [Panicum miliaceum]|uniref:Uncharacterized protein n=1 Tax=Panicum miliaceum TaxID=4540 RepID=A0A3L6QSG4_PANMI|nr:hypothetical protein C2845_PM04G33570 [Panicum miliaceum]